MSYSEADKTIADYLSCEWARVTAYDVRMRTALAADSEPDLFSSNDERTFHLACLVASARISGDRKFVDLLLDWVVDRRFAEWSRLQMTILVALVHAGFYRSALNLFERILAGSTKEWVIRGMSDSQVMFLSFGMVAPFFPEAHASRYRELFAGNKPWVPTAQLYQEVREGFLAQVRALRDRNEGGWEDIEGGTPAVPAQAVFGLGEFFDALRPIEAIIAATAHEVVLIDGYVTSDTLALFTRKRSGVAVRVLTKTADPALRSAFIAFNRQYHGLSLRTSDAFHDRFIIVDGSHFYHIGPSLKDLAKRTFMYSRIEDASVRTCVWQQFEMSWQAGKEVA